MRGTDLRAARERLGATQQEMAERARLRLSEFKEWELTEVPRRQRHAVDEALWEVERDRALARSALPECDWMRSREEAPWEFDADELLEHLQQCTACRARSEYVAAHVRPRPIGGSPLKRAFGILDRLDGWQQSAFAGALILLMMGGVGVPFLLGAAVLQQDPSFVAAAAGLFVVLVASGAAGGIVFFWTAPLRARGEPGRYLAWIVTVYGYLAAVAVLAAIGSLLFPAFAAETDMFSASAAPVVFLIVGALFGVIAAWQTRDAKPATREEPRKGSLFTLRNALFAIAFLIGIVPAVRSWLTDAGDRQWRESNLPELREAVRNDPEAARAARNLAWALLQTDHVAESLPALRRALELNPDDGYLHNGLGWTLNESRRWGEAVPVLQDAVRLESDHADARHNLGWALFNVGQSEAAEAEYRRGIALTPEVAGLHGDLGWVLLDLRELAAAEKEFRAAIRLEPENAGHHRGLARAIMQRGDLAAALDAHRKVVRLDPTSPYAWGDLGRVAHLGGNHAEAVAAFERADSLNAEYLERNEEARRMLLASRAGHYVEPRQPDSEFPD